MAISKKSSRQIEKEANDRVMQTIAWRAAFYRANPQRFVKDYLNVNLKWFQAIILWSMFHFTYVMYLAARGRLTLASPHSNMRAISGQNR